MKPEKFAILLAFLLALGIASGCSSSLSGSVQAASFQPTSSLQSEAQPPVSKSVTLDDADERAGNTVNLLLSSYSAKEFKEAPVSEQDIETILNCAIKSQSARNLQPWRFTVAKDFNMVKTLASHAVEGCVAVVVSGESTPQQGSDPVFDCALATQNMFTAAQSLGLGAHIYAMTVNSINTQYRDELEIPKGFDAVMVLLIGHEVDGVDAVASASHRKSFDDIVNYAG